MEKCSCWNTKSVVTKWRNGTPIDVETVQYCNGTKEQEACSCGGNVGKCDFYPEKRKESKGINTAEMWLKAQEDGKTYYWEHVKYQKDIGIVDIRGERPWPMSAWQSFDCLMNGKWKPYQTMTKSEAEAKFNIKIVDD